MRRAVVDAEREARSPPPRQRAVRRVGEQRCRLPAELTEQVEARGRRPVMAPTSAVRRPMKIRGGRR